MQVKSFVREIIVKEEGKSFDSCHASTLVQTEDGTVIAAWFGGSKEKGPDVAIWSARRVGGVWEAPQIAADIRGVATWNPVLFQKKDGTILLFFKAGAAIPEWKTWVAVSRDQGKTFSTPKELVPGDESGGRGPVKNKPIRLQNGTVLAPASLDGDTWDAFVDISKDDGISWEKSALVPVRRAGTDIHRPYNRLCLYGKGIIQPTLWEDADGNVHMLLRSTGGRIFRSDSTDGGYSWCTAYDTGIPNNNSGIDLVRMPGGDLVLVYNPRENLPGLYQGPRTPLTVAVSRDSGDTFTNLMDLETERGAYCYPAVICNDRNEILLTYTWKRENIVFCQLRYTD